MTAVGGGSFSSPVTVSLRQSSDTPPLVAIETVILIVIATVIVTFLIQFLVIGICW